MRLGCQRGVEPRAIDVQPPFLLETLIPQELDEPTRRTSDSRQSSCMDTRHIIGLDQVSPSCVIFHMCDIENVVSYGAYSAAFWGMRTAVSGVSLPTPFPLQSIYGSTRRGGTRFRSMPWYSMPHCD